MKKLVRLTESDLHRIVRESVNRILNEVQYGGENLHGNNVEDWNALARLRDARKNKVLDDYFNDAQNGKEVDPFHAACQFNRESNAQQRNDQNAGVASTEYGGFGGVLSNNKKGRNMANRIGLGKYYTNKY